MKTGTIITIVVAIAVISILTYMLLRKQTTNDKIVDMYNEQAQKLGGKLITDYNQPQA